jgi:hypothetical protein
MNKTNYRKRFFANKMHGELFWLVFGAATIPALLTTIFLYYFIFNVTAEQVGIPETIAHHIIPAAREVTRVLVFVVPFTILVILLISHKVSHRIVGPFDRIVREMRENLDGQRKGPINLRKADRFAPLVEQINKMIQRIEGN